jgi:small conductance mechanosensitive channel
MTHGWARAVFDIGVGYKENVDEVMSLLVEMGKQMRREPAYSQYILEDPEMLGVEEFGASAVVIKFHIKTRAIKRLVVKREMLRRIKNRFDELGIEIPYPHQVVYNRTDDGIATEDKEAKP